MDETLVQRSYQQLFNYFKSAQQSCGGFFNCEPNIWRDDDLIAYYLYPEDKLSIEAARVFDEKVYLQNYDLWKVLSPYTKDYTWWPLFDALALLSLNITSPLVSVVENIIAKNFSERGLVITQQAYYQSYFGPIPYDLMSTLLALDIAKKSEIVDGNLDFAKLNSTLNPSFWNYLKKYLSGEINANLKNDYIVSMLALLAMGIDQNLMNFVCNILNSTYFSKVYQNYENLRPSKYDARATSLLMDEALICSAFGYLNNTYAKKVSEWLFESYLINNGGALPKSIYAVSALGTLLGKPSKSFKLVSTEAWPSTQTSTTVSADATDTVTKLVTHTEIKTMIINKTLRETVTLVRLKSESLRSVNVGLPALGLLATFVRGLVIKRKEHLH